MVVNTFTGVSLRENLLEPSISGRFFEDSFLIYSISNKGKTKRALLFFSDPQMHEKTMKLIPTLCS